MAETLSLARVRMDGNTQVRETLDLVVISEYAPGEPRSESAHRKPTRQYSSVH